MGAGTYSEAAYNIASHSREYATKTLGEVFTNSSASTLNLMSNMKAEARKVTAGIKKEMLGVGIRECRDSKEHPNSTPIIIALDVTGSMRSIPHKMITEHLPKLMNAVQQMGVKDPQLLFMAIGDHEYDDYPVQTGQFESDTNKILDTLESLYLEGGGGGNTGESYLLAHIIAGYHTETDSWYNRNTKGFLFTIGDEPNLKRISSESLVKHLGYEKGVSEITAVEALDKAREQYHVFHIHVTDGSHRLDNSWKELLGDNLLTCNSSEVSKVIAQAIKGNYKESVEIPETESKEQAIY